MLIVAKLIYSSIASLDGYVADENGNFDWAAPDEEVHTFVNDLERQVGTYLYGRRMYEVMLGWETVDARADRPPFRHGLRRDLAGGRQDRVLEDAGEGVQRQDSDRARLRPRSGAAAERAGGTRHQRRRSRTCGSRDRGRVGRRVPPVRRTHRGGRRQAISPRRCPPRARIAGRTPFRQRHGSPPLPHRALRRFGSTPAVGRRSRLSP